MIGYKILEQGEVKDLEARVHSAINAGWRPLGGMCVNSRVRNGRCITEFYQTMTKDRMDWETVDLETEND